mmetsp:Transcript_7979/g.11535  ORF Transcript_7979/g.11535 Transcript_7979/m.11535 type:complete len:372 (-) Transcript_7979:534-1649(-)|eukprot:CAMPEP_0194248562 /NCGR_PEP_ID=MMETSP0158-20130606/18625_1 /TAXON_ID=33649 /ORGANISM="Thalassionema nitzschioides, Strain L26-B" /LENGTH=371 /DNA_ID=CAMNT_0038984893 /DNA_START=22 /DNA_END=1137 /DNA_ORIENTATION=-
MSENEDVNPAIITSVGGLLTEELAMNPYTSLPSFYEMKLIEEAENFAQRTLKDGVKRLADQAPRYRTLRSNSFFAKLKNRLCYIVSFIALKYDSEIRLFIKYFMERQYLRSSCSTVAESLYGGVRSKVLKDNKLARFTKADSTVLALLISIGWYADEKLEDLFARWSEEEVRNQDEFRIFFVQIYPYLHMLKNGTILAYQLLYLAGKSVFFHPSSHLLGMVVRRQTASDANINRKINKNKDERLLKAWIPYVRKIAFWTVSATIAGGWIYRLQRYVRERERESLAVSSMPPPPDAPPLNIDRKKRIRAVDSDVCSLCQQPWIAPSATPSGYVFCHKCLILYVRENKKCPLTGSKCSEEEIIRIFEPQALID